MLDNFKQTLIFIFILFVFCGSAFSQIAVVVNENNTIENLKLDELKRIYLGNLTFFQNKQPIVLGEYEPAAVDFYRILMDQTVLKIKKHWIAVVFSGKNANPPINLKDTIRTLEFLKENPGGITFLPVSEVSEGMKIVTIDGISPEQPDYPLSLDNK